MCCCLGVVGCAVCLSVAVLIVVLLLCFDCLWVVVGDFARLLRCSVAFVVLLVWRCRAAVMLCVFGFKLGFLVADVFGLCFCGCCLIVMVSVVCCLNACLVVCGACVMISGVLDVGLFVCYVWFCV